MADDTTNNDIVGDEDLEDEEEEESNAGVMPEDGIPPENTDPSAPSSKDPDDM